MIRKYAEIFCWKNVSSFCSAKATHIFSAKNIRILYIESAKIVNEMTLNKLVKLTTLWTTGPRLKLPKKSPQLTAKSTFSRNISVSFKANGIIRKDGMTSSLYIRVTLMGTTQWWMHYNEFTHYTELCRKPPVLYFDYNFLLHNL